MSRLALFTRAALLACIASACGCEVDLQRMLDQHKYEAYESNTFFEDGRSMRHPPPHTVPHSAELGPAELLTGRSAAGDYVRDVPLPVDEQVLARGQDRFRIYCQVCHGALGDGQSQVAENMKLRKPPSLHEPRLRGYPAGRLFRVIGDGYGLMPSYARELGVHDRWAVTAFVQALQLSQNVVLATLPSPLQQEARPWLE